MQTLLLLHPRLSERRHMWVRHSSRCDLYRHSKRAEAGRRTVQCDEPVVETMIEKVNSSASTGTEKPARAYSYVGARTAPCAKHMLVLPILIATLMVTLNMLFVVSLRSSPCENPYNSVRHSRLREPPIGAFPPQFSRRAATHHSAWARFF